MRIERVLHMQYSLYIIIIYTETKNVAVYICKANFIGDAEKHELTINKGDHVNVLDKTDGGK